MDEGNTGTEQDFLVVGEQGPEGLTSFLASPSISGLSGPPGYPDLHGIPGIPGLPGLPGIPGVVGHDPGVVVMRPIQTPGEYPNNPNVLIIPRIPEGWVMNNGLIFMPHIDGSTISGMGVYLDQNYGNFINLNGVKFTLVGTNVHISNGLGGKISLEGLTRIETVALPGGITRLSPTVVPGFDHHPNLHMTPMAGGVVNINGITFTRLVDGVDLASANDQVVLNGVEFVLIGGTNDIRIRNDIGGSLIIDGLDVENECILEKQSNNAIIIKDVGGNTRGENAVDLQQSRSNALKVASEGYSVTGGGRFNSSY